jgi:hypothetical protein
MFKKLFSESVPLTPAVAQAHADLAPMPGERAIRQSRLKFLLAALDDGRFAGPDWHVGIYVPTGERYRLEGQHSSRMLASLPAERFPANLVLTMTTWEFETWEEAADLFDIFNNPRSVRNNEDAMGIYRAQMPGISNIDRAVLVHVANGICEWESGRGDQGTVLPPRRRGLYFYDEENQAFAVWVDRFSECKNASFLRRQGVMAEMLVDWRVSADEATAFWEYVLRESHPDPDDVTRELAETYRMWLTKRNRSNQEFRQKAARAWKVFVRSQLPMAAA